MRRVTILLAAAAAVFLVGSGLALAATITGTEKNETFLGTRYADTIRARGGDDVVRGRGGSDRLHGGFDNDIIRGGRGDDVIYAQDINQTTDRGTRDEVYCGTGDDVANIDERDRYPRNRDGCEEVVGVSP